MEDFWLVAVEFVNSEGAVNAFYAVIKLLVGLGVARLVGRGLRRLLDKQSDPHRLMLVERVSFYLIFGLFVVSAAGQMGFDLSILLGAAGILTVALGFASQTSASNVISGLFLLGEKPFSIGDIIRVGQTTGEVLSIDLLSVKLRTFDNLFVRIPNETMIKSEIVNLNRFPIRRLDMQIGVAYKEDLEKVREVLFEVAYQHPLCLEEPQPLIIFLGFGDSALNHQFSIWASRENYLELKNTIPSEIKKAFDQHNIEIPFPHRTLYAGSETKPFPVEVVAPSEAQQEQS